LSALGADNTPTLSSGLRPSANTNLKVIHQALCSIYHRLPKGITAGWRNVLERRSRNKLTDALLYLSHRRLSAWVLVKDGLEHDAQDEPHRRQLGLINLVVCQRMVVPPLFSIDR
jgi:hypothetical protein